MKTSPESRKIVSDLKRTLAARPGLKEAIAQEAAAQVGRDFDPDLWAENVRRYKRQCNATGRKY